MKLILMESIGKKHFYWDPSISESAVNRKWDVKAATRYIDFIARRKASKVKPSYVPVNVWESWMQLCGDAKCVERSKINSKNRCGGGEVAAGTLTGGSITIEVHRKRLVEIQHRVCYICTFIYLIMMENLLFRSVPELSMYMKLFLHHLLMVVTPTVPPATTNAGEVDPLASGDDHSP